MDAKKTPLVILVVGLVALVGSIAWAVTEADDDGWTMGHYGPGMMVFASTGTGDPVRSLVDAKRQAGRFADRLDLEVGEVMRFTNHYYAELEEEGKRATEVLVEPRSGAVFLEYGPAMMWNTRYGMMSDSRLSGPMMGGAGMMGAGMMGRFADPTWAPGPPAGGDVSAGQAKIIAQRWLDRYGSGWTADELERFPGYYTLHMLRNGKVAGMLSVNEATGAVWHHWWHGRFVAMEG